VKPTGRPGESEYLTARRDAGTARGMAFAARLKAMGPHAAAAELDGMFALVAREDLAAEIAGDLQVDRESAVAIARAMRKRWRHGLGFDRKRSE
jgi:hypothetical protein